MCVYDFNFKKKFFFMRINYNGLLLKVYFYLKKDTRPGTGAETTNGLLSINKVIQYA